MNSKWGWMLIGGVEREVKTAMSSSPEQHAFGFCFQFHWNSHSLQSAANQLLAWITELQ